MDPDLTQRLERLAVTAQAGFTELARAFERTALLIREVAEEWRDHD